MFVRYPSIEQFRTIVKQVKQRVQYVGKDESGFAVYDNGIILPKIKFKGTVKLHGTNAAVGLDNNGNFWCQSRERVLSIESDNAAFCFNMTGISAKIISEMKTYFEAEPNLIKVIYFGEWCGGNIQKGVALSQLDKQFIGFNVYKEYSDGTVVWSEFNRSNVFKSISLDFPTYEIEIDFEKPESSQNKLIEITTDVENECPVGKSFGVSDFVKWVVSDVVKEETDVLIANGLEPKDVGSAVSKAARNWYLGKI